MQWLLEPELVNSTSKLILNATFSDSSMKNSHFIFQILLEKRGKCFEKICDDQRHCINRNRMIRLFIVGDNQTIESFL